MNHVHTIFENIAQKYDKMNDIISFGQHRAWRRVAMKKISMQPGQTAIDVCCGTCDWAIDLAKASGTGRIVGLDFSRNMLEVARTKITRLGLQDQIELVEDNAMALPFPDETFDIATIGWGLRNVPDYLQVLKEMHRVVKPGGLVACLDMSKPTWQPFKGIYYFYFEKIMPYLGKVFAGDYESYAWLPESLKSFPGRDGLAELFYEAGSRSVDVTPFFGGIACLHIGRK